MRRRIAIGAAVLGFAILVGLGAWQLDRRAWKQALIAEVDAGLAADPVVLTDGPAPDAVQTLQWRRAEAAGEWAPTGLVRITPRTMDGVVGADYAAPLVLADGSVIVVLLGFGAEGVQPPALRAEAARISGVMARAARPSAFTPDNAPPDDWYWLEPPAIAAHAGLRPEMASPLTLRLDTPIGALTPRPSRPVFADNHLQYAFTWFGLAAALAAVALLLFRRRRPGD